jgi:hypothetical protein
VHEQRKVTRSPDASGKPQDTLGEKNKITAVPPPPAALRASASPASGKGGKLNFGANQEGA